MAKSYDPKRTIATGSLVFPYVFHWPQLPPEVLEPAPDPIFLLRRSYISIVLASGVGLEDIYAVRALSSIGAHASGAVVCQSGRLARFVRVFDQAVSVFRDVATCAHVAEHAEEGMLVQLDEGMFA
jgi:hypothetical protein